MEAPCPSSLPSQSMAHIKKGNGYREGGNEICHDFEMVDQGKDLILEEKRSF